MHNHCHCEHKLKHCGVCDIVFCETCKKEWKVQSNYFSYGGGAVAVPCNIPNPYVGTAYSPSIGLPTNGGLAGQTGTINNHNHQ